MGVAFLIVLLIIISTENSMEHLFYDYYFHLKFKFTCASVVCTFAFSDCLLPYLSNALFLWPVCPCFTEIRNWFGLGLDYLFCSLNTIIQYQSVIEYTFLISIFFFLISGPIAYLTIISTFISYDGHSYPLPLRIFFVGFFWIIVLILDGISEHIGYVCRKLGLSEDHFKFAAADILSALHSQTI